MLAGNTRPMEQLLVGRSPLRPRPRPAHHPPRMSRSRWPPSKNRPRKSKAPTSSRATRLPFSGARCPPPIGSTCAITTQSPWRKNWRIPILILQGGRDFQVPPATNFEEWKAALGGQRNVTLKLYPELNHLFIAGTGPSLPQEYEKPGHVDERAIAEIATWVSTGGKTPHLGN